MAIDLFANSGVNFGARGTLASDPGSGGTTLTLTTGHGARFPTVASPNVLRLLVEDELMLVTAHAAAADTMTVTRGIEGTTAAAHASGTTVAVVLTAAGISSFGLAPGTLGPGIVAPFHPLMCNGVFAVAAANWGWTVRVVVHRTGVLNDLTILQNVSSGNICVGVYDTGDASSGNRTRLYTTGSIACPAANAWRVVGDPAINVVAGQQLDFALVADNTTATFGGYSLVLGQAGQLPTNFWPAAGGALPKLSSILVTQLPLPTTLTEANLTQPGSQVPMIIARIT